MKKFFLVQSIFWIGLLNCFGQYTTPGGQGGYNLGLSPIYSNYFIGGTLVGVNISPTNQYTLTGGSISGTNLGYTFTFIGTNTSSFHIGDDIIFTNNQQYRITDIPNATNVTVDPIIQSTALQFTNPIVYPAAVVIYDVRGTPYQSGYIANDGSYGVIGKGGTNLFNSGSLQLGNGVHTFTIVGNFGDPRGPALVMTDNANFYGNEFMIFEGSYNGVQKYESLVILPDGTVSSRFGLTNYNGGVLHLLGTVNADSGIGSTSVIAPQTITATGVTNNMGVVGVAYVTCTATTFTNFDNAGTKMLTNTTATYINQAIILQPGGAIKSASGLSGRLVPF